VSFTAKPRNGEAYDVETDILLGADGIKSAVRTALLMMINSSAEVEDTGQAAYRIMLSRSQMEKDPEMLELLDSDCALRWIGEKRHIVAYPISNKTIYNLSTCQPDTNFAAAPSVTYTTRGEKSAMLQVYGDFCPLVQRMLNLVPEGEVCEWRLRSHKPLETWTLGAVALVGDACHPTLPHLGQGATMAIEDGAVLAECISAVPLTDGKIDREALSRSLKVYELLRKERTSILVDLAAFSGRLLHLGEGKAKEERDRQFAESRKKGNAVPDKWASPEVQQMVYSHDCVKEAQENFDELYASLATQKTNGVIA
jgi:salicylate hydroxylase